MIHLVKLCVGFKDLSHLRQHVLSLNVAPGQAICIATRLTPKKKEELLEGGSLYWVIGGAIRARQRIMGVETQTGADGKSRCVILLDTQIVDTAAARYKPFQGWRYLDPGKAPADMQGDDLPEGLRSDLAELGLI